ncbi:MAG: hypothetical protein U9Q16_00375, partial [Patescibacteria group bacterium]|nr:hypothetical protein [Patescibacteria group bacterium]
MNFIKNKKVLSILSLSFIFSILPKTISALSWNPLNWTIIGLPALLIGTILGVATKVSALGALILANLLNWIIGPNFLSWSWTQPGGDHGNPIIAVGLNITKNFVNLGLVLILIFIAFSVALRLNQYATEKTLVRLIIIAL